MLHQTCLDEVDLAGTLQQIQLQNVTESGFKLSGLWRTLSSSVSRATISENMEFVILGSLCSKGSEIKSRPYLLCLPCKDSGSFVIHAPDGSAHSTSINRYELDFETMTQTNMDNQRKRTFGVSWTQDTRRARWTGQIDG